MTGTGRLPRGRRGHLKKKVKLPKISSPDGNSCDKEDSWPTRSRRKQNKARLVMGMLKEEADVAETKDLFQQMSFAEEQGRPVQTVKLMEEAIKSGSLPWPVPITMNKLELEQAKDLPNEAANCSLFFEGETEADLKAWEGFKFAENGYKFPHKDGRVVLLDHKTDAWYMKYSQARKRLMATYPDPKSSAIKSDLEYLAKMFNFKTGLWKFSLTGKGSGGKGVASLSAIWQQLCLDAFNGRLPKYVCAVILSNEGGQKEIQIQVTKCASKYSKNTELMSYLASIGVVGDVSFRPDVYNILGDHMTWKRFKGVQFTIKLATCLRKPKFKALVQEWKAKPKHLERIDLQDSSSDGDDLEGNECAGGGVCTEEPDNSGEAGEELEEPVEESRENWEKPLEEVVGNI